MHTYMYIYTYKHIYFSLLISCNNPLRHLKQQVINKMLGCTYFTVIRVGTRARESKNDYVSQSACLNSLENCSPSLRRMQSCLHS